MAYPRKFMIEKSDQDYRQLYFNTLRNKVLPKYGKEVAEKVSYMCLRYWLDESKSYKKRYCYLRKMEKDLRKYGAKNWSVLQDL